MDLMSKLQIKKHNSFLIIHLPGSLQKEFQILRFDTATDLSKQYDMIMIFAQTMEESRQLIKETLNLLNDDGLYWYCYPKLSSKKYKSDINRDKTLELFTDYHFRPVRQIALDDDWSSLRFRDGKYVK